MSDDDNSPPELEEALAAIEAASNQRRQAHEGVKEASQAIDGVRGDAHELEEVVGELYGLVEKAEGLARNITGASGYSTAGIEVAWDETADPYDLLKEDMSTELQIAQDVIQAHIDAADDDERVSGEFVTDSGERYEVTFERVETDADADEETDIDADTDADTDSDTDAETQPDSETDSEDGEGLGELFG